VVAVDLGGDAVFVAGVECAEEVGAVGVSECEDDGVDVVFDEDVLDARESAEVLESVLLAIAVRDGFREERNRFVLYRGRRAEVPNQRCFDVCGQLLDFLWVVADDDCAFGRAAGSASNPDEPQGKSDEQNRRHCEQRLSREPVRVVEVADCGERKCGNEEALLGEPDRVEYAPWSGLIQW